MNWLCRWEDEDKCVSVGYYLPNGEWSGCFEVEHFDEAARRINYLNGGLGMSLDEQEQESSRVESNHVFLTLHRLSELLCEVKATGRFREGILDTLIQDMQSLAMDCMTRGIEVK